MDVHGFFVAFDGRNAENRGSDAALSGGRGLSLRSAKP